MDLMDKLTILTDAAKYDAACTSSGIDRTGKPGRLGSAAACGICHTFTADGRCVSLLKVLQSNVCAYDCRYCVNRRSNQIRRAAFSPRELADLTIQFYRRNYIEGLFLSSAVSGTPDNACEQMLETLSILRREYGFGGYIHAKAIPGADDRLLQRLGLLADRVSVNIELPSQQSLGLLAPDKTRESILGPMKRMAESIAENKTDLVRYRSAPKFAPAGQSTQMIIGATPDTDYQILNLTAGLYKKYQLKRVFFSAYLPVVEDIRLPALDTAPPLLREHRLYRADWLLRFYGFDASELLDENQPNFNPLLDPKCCWALRHMDQFPVEINQAPYEILLRIPGVGVRSARRIATARRAGSLGFEDLKKLGVVLKRAKYFITCRGKRTPGAALEPDLVLEALLSRQARDRWAENECRQLSLFDPPERLTREEARQCVVGQI